MTMRHWTEYAIEAAGLGLFMLSALSFTVILEHPLSPVRDAIPDPLLRRVVMGLAMGGTFVAIAYSRWGARSGAHLNPAVTLTFLRLGKVARRDALGYVTAQFAGGMAGTLAGALLLGPLAAAPEVRYVATVPGPMGVAVAFAAEIVISFLLMTMVLHVSNHRRVARFTALLAGGLVAVWITVEAPFSGMSMNPARSLGPAVVSGMPTALWIYFTAPPIGMLLAAELFVRARGLGAVFCAKLNHGTGVPCPFNCHFSEMPT
jgi:aquaporin Z